MINLAYAKHLENNSQFCILFYMYSVRFLGNKFLILAMYFVLYVLDPCSIQWHPNVKWDIPQYYSRPQLGITFLEFYENTNWNSIKTVMVSNIPY